ncbi:MAG: hypothetical protein GC191_20720 [Azospirillum sp.]|nr:hypothetical protein [Azospirillum sp.]
MNSHTGITGPLSDTQTVVRLAELPAVALRDQTANPAPLGLCAFGLTTVLLNMHNAGLFGLDAMIVSMGLFYGGTAQVIAGYMEWKKANTFATTAFISFGFFWLSLCGILIMPKLGIAAAPTATAMASWLGIWGIFAFVLFIGTFKLNRALQVTFFLLIILFGLLVAGDLTGDKTYTRYAGWEGIACGLAAIYTGLAQVLNEVYGRVVCPLGPMKK